MLQTMKPVIMEKEALQLPVAERVRLVDALMDSLDDEAAKEIEAAWASEADSRRDAFLRGELETEDGLAAIAAARHRLRA